MARPRGPLPIVILLALAALVVVVYLPVGHFSFVDWDDPSYITANPHIVGGLTWHNLAWAITTGYTPYWHPLTWISHLVDIQLFGLDAGAHHLTNLAFHLANTLLLFALLRRLTGEWAPSAFVAAVFGVHPLHVESVAWVTERKDVLSTCLLLLTIWIFADYARRPHWARYLAMTACFALALMAKPMVVTLPLVLLLLDVWPLGRFETTPARTLWLEKVPLVLLAGAVGLATIAIQQHVGALAGLAALPLSARIANATVAYVIYLRQAFWPAGLAAFYPQQIRAAWRVITAALLLAGITAAAIRSRRTRPFVFVGWAWYVVTLAPVVGLLQAGEQAHADRFMYVPLVGLAIVVAWGLPRAAAAVWNDERSRRAVLGGVAVASVIALSVLAHPQVETWSTSYTLWQHALAVTDRNYIAYQKLAEAMRDDGRFDEATANYTRALALAPPNSPVYEAMVHNDLGLILVREKRPADAAREFTQATTLDPAFAEAQGNLGNALAAAGDLADAVEHFDDAIRLRPDLPEAQMGLGAALLREGKVQESAAHFSEALRLAPTLAEADNGLGAALALEGDTSDAIARYREAIRLKPDLANAHVNLALALAGENQDDEAIAELQRAIALDEPQPTWHFNLAVLLAARQRTDEALRHFERALELDPELAAAQRAIQRLTAR